MRKGSYGVPILLLTLIAIVIWISWAVNQDKFQKIVLIAISGIVALVILISIAKMLQKYQRRIREVISGLLWWRNRATPTPPAVAITGSILMMLALTLILIKWGPGKEVQPGEIPIWLLKLTLVAITTVASVYLMKGAGLSVRAIRAITLASLAFMLLAHSDAWSIWWTKRSWANGGGCNQASSPAIETTTQPSNKKGWRIVVGSTTGARPRIFHLEGFDPASNDCYAKFVNFTGKSEARLVGNKTSIVPTKWAGDIEQLRPDGGYDRYPFVLTYNQGTRQFQGYWEYPDIPGRRGSLSIEEE